MPAFLLAVGVLVTFHEFGHYWVARRFGVKILRFSIGFGRPFYLRRYGADATEFTVCWVPLGGYVKMLDTREGIVAPEDVLRAFDKQPLWRRGLIIVAGPAFNMLFAALAWWVVFMAGEAGLRPQVDKVVADTPAAAAGFRAGDEITEVLREATPTWSAVFDGLMSSLIKGETATLKVRDAEHGERTLRLDMAAISIDALHEGDFLTELGLEPVRPPMPAIIGALSEGGAAKQAGLRVGDQILTSGGEEVMDWQSWVNMVRVRPGRELPLQVRRGPDTIRLVVVPQRVIEEETGQEVGRVGAALRRQRGYHEAYADMWAVRSWSPPAALWRAVRETWDKSVLVVDTLVQMFSGRVSVRHLGGPLTIADYAGRTAQAGVVAFFGFLAIVSVNLGVLNLLPVPPLDGGQLLYCSLEALRGKPLSDRVQEGGMHLGMLLLLLLIVVVLRNDILRLMSQ